MIHSMLVNIYTFMRFGNSGNLVNLLL